MQTWQLHHSVAATMEGQLTSFGTCHPSAFPELCYFKPAVRISIIQLWPLRVMPGEGCLTSATFAGRANCELRIVVIRMTSALFYSLYIALQPNITRRHAVDVRVVVRR